MVLVIQKLLSLWQNVTKFYKSISHLVNYLKNNGHNDFTFSKCRLSNSVQHFFPKQSLFSTGKTMTICCPIFSWVWIALCALSTAARYCAAIHCYSRSFTDILNEGATYIQKFVVKRKYLTTLIYCVIVIIRAYIRAYIKIKRYS